MSQLPSYFPTRDEDKPERPNEASLELAFVGYSFLFVDEQTNFGPWNLSNEHRLRELQNVLLDLEVELLLSTSVFRTLTLNPQVLCEFRLQSLHQAGILTGAQTLQARSVVPFFERAAMLQKASDSMLDLEQANGLLYDFLHEIDADLSAGALAAVAMLTLSKLWNNSSYIIQVMCACFDVYELKIANALLNAAYFAKNVAFLRLGCFGNTNFALAKFLREKELQDSAQRMSVAIAHATLAVTGATVDV